MSNIKNIEKELNPLKKELTNHSLYKTMNEIEDIKIFMEWHIFAVWDFISLVKSLQNHLTCVDIPWTPVKNTKVARFINEIVHGEESDENEKGEIKSHFEMYLDAMDQVGAKYTYIDTLITRVKNKENIEAIIDDLNLPRSIHKFLSFTFKTIATNKPHLIAGAFTYGREDLIPDMFFQIINETKNSETYNKLTYYLQRHIDIDGDEHGPLALLMIDELCNNEEEKINEVIEISKEALRLRIDLWSFIHEEIKKSKLVLSN